MRNPSRRVPAISAFAFASCALVGTPVMAQTPPPIGGVSGTIAPEGSGDQVEAGANAVAAKTAEGTRRLFHALLLHGKTDAPMNDFLSGLRPGSTLVLHYAASGTNSTPQEPDRKPERVREGMVLSINRARQEISVRLDDKTVDTLQLAVASVRDGAPDDANAPAGPQRVVVDYTDDAGRKLSHSFTQKP